MSSSPEAHWAAIIAFVMAAVWLGIISVIWIKSNPARDLTVWGRSIGVIIIIFILTPIMIYFAWPPADTQPQKTSTGRMAPTPGGSSTNKLGDISGNSGIVTQGQNGDNTIRK
jgi:energy-coupling factor transporter transmembrane protein EcfT